MIVDYEKLKLLYSRASLSKLSKNPKKYYKNVLVSMFVTFLKVGDFQSKQFEFISKVYLCEDILTNPKEYLDEQSFQGTESTIRRDLQNIFVKNPSSDETKNKIIDLVRQVLDYWIEKEERYLLKAKELDNLIDLKAYFEHNQANANPNQKPHHWIEVDLQKGLIPTFPDFLAYADLISLWNMYVDKQKAFKEEKDRMKQRALDSELHALHTALWTQAVTFVESYLYYVFYDINKGKYSLKSTKAQGYIKSTLPDDNQIIESLIIAEFSNQDNTEEITNIKELHKEYKSINNVRNRFIHISAFDENERSHLIPLISNRSDQLINSLEVCTNLVKAIENLLPTELKLLFWWDAMEHPVYKEFIKGNFITRTDI